MRILLAEDHEELATTVAAGLRREGMAVDVALDGGDAVLHAAATDYDVVVLDRDLPGVHGDDVCRALVADGRPCRILMLTAAAALEDLVGGLSLGADDYVAKPFRFPELVARIRALARRPPRASPPVLAHGDLRLDCGRRCAERAGRALPLSPKEFAVLEVLMAAGGAVVASEELLERVWDEALDPFTNTVKTTVSRLRAKLGDPPMIDTVPRAGYRLL